MARDSLFGTGWSLQLGLVSDSGGLGGVRDVFVGVVQWLCTPRSGGSHLAFAAGLCAWLLRWCMLAASVAACCDQRR